MKYNFDKNNAKAKSSSGTTAKDFLDFDELVLWKGHPKKSSYILNNMIKMMPFAIIWLVFDGFFISMLFTTGDQLPSEMLFFLIFFFAFHLMPVWIWLGSTFSAAARWKRIEYIVTEKRILISNGLHGVSVNSIYYNEISHVAMHIGVIDKMTHVGDVYLYRSCCGFDGHSSKGVSGDSILDVTEIDKVYRIVEKCVRDAHSKKETSADNYSEEYHNKGELI